jgi:hypothetical protein
LDKATELAEDINLKTARLEERSVSLPRRVQRLVGVMEEIDVARSALRSQCLIQGYATRDIALAGFDPVPSYETTDRALELGESHCRISADLTKASRSPWRSIKESTRRTSAAVSG